MAKEKVKKAVKKVRKTKKAAKAPTNGTKTKRVRKVKSGSQAFFAGFNKVYHTKLGETEKPKKAVTPAFGTFTDYSDGDRAVRLVEVDTFDPGKSWADLRKDFDIFRDHRDNQNQDDYDGRHLGIHVRSTGVNYVVELHPDTDELMLTVV